MQNKRFVRLPNAIFGLGLRPLELGVYLQLAGCTNQLGGCVVRQQTIANALGCSRQTVNRAVQLLKAKGLLAVSARYLGRSGERRRVSSRYSLAVLPGNFTRLPIEALHMGLTPAELAVYAYQFSCRNQQTLEAFPSLRKIATTLHISRNTVVAANAVLENRGVSYKVNYRRQDRSFGHNRYTVVTPSLLRFYAAIMLHMRKGAKKWTAFRQKAAQRMSTMPIKPKINIIVDRFCAAVKRHFLFWGRGGIHLVQQEQEPPE